MFKSYDEYVSFIMGLEEEGLTYRHFGAKKWAEIFG